MNNYKLLKRVDFDNPLLMTDQLYFFTLNRVQWARPDKETTLSGMAGIKERLQKSYAAYQKLMGTDHNTLTAQLCNYKWMQLSFDEWRIHQDALPLYLSSFTHPYVCQKAEEFYKKETAKIELTTPLPDGPGMEIIRDIIARYPNRYLLIDFW